MFTHKVLINTAHSIHELKLDLLDSDMHIADFSNESLIFYEKPFWTNTFLRPVAKCKREKEGMIELCFCLRKSDRIFLLLYLITGCIISFLTRVMGETNGLPFVIILWLAITLLLFLMHFKYNCKRIAKKIISLQK